MVGLCIDGHILDLITTRIEWVIKYFDREELQKTIPCYDVKVIAIMK